MQNFKILTKFCRIVFIYTTSITSSMAMIIDSGNILETFFFLFWSSLIHWIKRSINEQKRKIIAADDIHCFFVSLSWIKVNIWIKTSLNKRGRKKNFFFSFIHSNRKHCVICCQRQKKKVEVSYELTIEKKTFIYCSWAVFFFLSICKLLSSSFIIINNTKKNTSLEYYSIDIIN